LLLPTEILLTTNLTPTPLGGYNETFYNFYHPADLRLCGRCVDDLDEHDCVGAKRYQV
jgi:hypothetical protein